MLQYKAETDENPNGHCLPTKSEKNLFIPKKLPLAQQQDNSSFLDPPCCS